MQIIVVGIAIFSQLHPFHLFMHSRFMEVLLISCLAVHLLLITVLFITEKELQNLLGTEIVK
jgi:hypothetical protein